MHEGSLLFARYALMPNRLGYCGGDEWEALLGYCLEGRGDEGLLHLIRQFQAAYPYLQFIARATGIGDPLHPRVVEAYWLGNELLERVEGREFYRFLEERFASRIPPRLRRYVLGKVPQGARPHHTFHVLEVGLRTGVLKESLEALDRCRISWGEVREVQGELAVVRYRPLVLREGRLALGEPVEERASFRLRGRGYLEGLKPGDLVSLHWGWICDRLTPRQAQHLERQTRHHLALASQTL